MLGDRPCSHVCFIANIMKVWQWKGRIVPWFVNRYIHGFKYLVLSSRSLWAPLKNRKASFDLLRTFGLGSVSKRVMRLWLEDSVGIASCWRHSALESLHFNSEEQALHWQVFISYQILNSWKNAAHSWAPGRKTPSSSSSLFWEVFTLCHWDQTSVIPKIPCWVFRKLEPLPLLLWVAVLLQLIALVSWHLS